MTLKRLYRATVIAFCFAVMGVALISCSGAGSSSAAGAGAAPPPGPSRGRLEMDINVAALQSRLDEIQASTSGPSTTQELVVDLLDPGTRRLVVASNVRTLDGTESSVKVLIESIPPGQWLLSVLLRDLGPTAFPSAGPSSFPTDGIPYDPNRVEQLVDIFPAQVTVVQLDLRSPDPVPTPGSVALFPLPDGTNPIGIVTGPDQNLWFTSGSSVNPPVPGIDQIGQLTTAGAVSLFPLPANSQPLAIVSVPSDNSLWFTERAGAALGRIGTDGAITPFGVGAGSLPAGLTFGPDGNIWFVESSNTTRSIGRMALTGGPPTLFPVPSLAPELSDITTGSDGNLWFTEHQASQVGRITPAGAVTEFPAGANPLAITLGPDGNVWYTRDTPGAGAIENMSPTGATTAFPLASPTLVPIDITLGPDGNLWATAVDGASGTASVLRITPAGAITEFPLGVSGFPVGITSGPDGNLWVALAGATQVARVTP